jgi:hypothetical protein
MKMLRRIFGPSREKEVEKCKNVYSKELHIYIIISNGSSSPFRVEAFYSVP